MRKDVLVHSHTRFASALFCGAEASWTMRLPSADKRRVGSAAAAPAAASAPSTSACTIRVRTQSASLSLPPNATPRAPTPDDPLRLMLVLYEYVQS